MSKGFESDYITPLKAVPESDISSVVDSWAMPTNLPDNILMSPRRFLGERWWKLDLENIALIPLPAIAIRVTLQDYIDFPVLVHNHRKWMLENQVEIPESYQQYEIYFLSDTYLHHREDRTAENIRHVYRMVHVDGEWKEEEVCFNHVPRKPCHENKAGSRIIMMCRV